GRVGDHQIAARGHLGHEAGGDAVRVLVVTDQMQHADELHRDGPAEVQCPAGVVEDLVRVAQVGIDVVGGTVAGAGQQRAGVGQHDRVVVRVHDPGGRRDLLGDLVDVRTGGDAGTDVEELPDAGVVGQVGHRTLHERPVGPDVAHDRRPGRHHRLAGRPVGGEVVLAAQPVVVDPGRV